MPTAADDVARAPHALPFQSVADQGKGNDEATALGGPATVSNGRRAGGSRRQSFGGLGALRVASSLPASSSFASSSSTSLAGNFQAASGNGPGSVNISITAPQPPQPPQSMTSSSTTSSTLGARRGASRLSLAPAMRVNLGQSTAAASGTSGAGVTASVQCTLFTDDAPDMDDGTGCTGCNDCNGGGSGGGNAGGASSSFVAVPDAAIKAAAAEPSDPASLLPPPPVPEAATKAVTEAAPEAKVPPYTALGALALPAADFGSFLELSRALAAHRGGGPVRAARGESLASNGGGEGGSGAPVHWQERLKGARLVGGALASLHHASMHHGHHSHHGQGSMGGAGIGVSGDADRALVRSCAHELLGDLHQKVVSAALDGVVRFLAALAADTRAATASSDPGASASAEVAAAAAAASAAAAVPVVSPDRAVLELALSHAVARLFDSKEVARGLAREVTIYCPAEFHLPSSMHSGIVPSWPILALHLF